MQASHEHRGEVFLADGTATAWIISDTALTGDEHHAGGQIDETIF